MIGSLTLLCVGWAASLQQSARTTPIRPAFALRASAPTALSPAELIDQGVAIATFAPQPLWLLMIAFPRSHVTRAVMEPLAPILLLGLIHFAIVVLAASNQDAGTAPVEIFFDVFDPAQSQLDGMERLFAFRNFVAEEWPHALA